MPRCHEAEVPRNTFGTYCILIRFIMITKEQSMYFERFNDEDVRILYLHFTGFGTVLLCCVVEKIEKCHLVHQDRNLIFMRRPRQGDTEFEV